MQRFSTLHLLLLLLLQACTSPDGGPLTSFGVYCEMVANGAKPIALSAPMEGPDADQYWPEMQEVAQAFGVQVYREDAFPISLLFPAELTEGKSVVLIYDGLRLEQYQQWKKDVNSYGGVEKDQLEALARRFGRLLGYGSEGINQLLRKNTDFRTLQSFGMEQQTTHLYYADLQEAIEFYENTLGLQKEGANQFLLGQDARIALHPFAEQHPEGQAKSTAIALLTDQLADWYSYVQEQGVPIKYTYKPREGGPHDGFVAIDPGGYLLEFEHFKQHPENELFIAALASAPKVPTEVNDLSFYGSITWTYHRDMLKMQQFYEEVLGCRLVADQGWTKIYQTTASGFIGLVDECRGMEDYAETKAVELEWSLAELEGFEAYARQHWQELEFSDSSVLGPEGYVYRFGSANK